MTRASMTLIVCLVTSVWPAAAHGQTTASGLPAPSAQQATTRTAWRVAARLLARKGGDRLDQPKGFLASDPAAGRIRFEGHHPDAFDVGYDQITSVHYEHGAKHPGGLFNKGLEFYLTIHHAADAGAQRASTVRLDEDDVSSTIERLEADTGLKVDRTEAKRSFLGLPIRVAVGDRVSITDVTGRKLKGRIATLSDSSLGLDGSGGAARVFDNASVARVRLRFSPGRSALRGFLAGAGPGALYVALFCSGYGGCGAEDLKDILLLTVGVGGIGAGSSVAIGAIVHPLSKSHEVYSRRGGGGGSSAALTGGPLVTRQRRGVAVSVTF
jgi:hypothetical protein